MGRALSLVGILACLGMIGGCGDSKTVARIKQAIINNVEQRTDKYFVFSDAKIDHIEKGNPSKEIIDQYNQKATYCVRCKYTWENKAHHKQEVTDHYIALLTQSGDIYMINSEIISKNQPETTFDFRRDDSRSIALQIEKQAKGTEDIMNRLWATTCPFPQQKK